MKLTQDGISIIQGARRELIHGIGLDRMVSRKINKLYFMKKVIRQIILAIKNFFGMRVSLILSMVIFSGSFAIIYIFTNRLPELFVF